jgi:hypothetical protein
MSAPLDDDAVMRILESSRGEGGRKGRRSTGFSAIDENLDTRPCPACKYEVPAPLHVCPACKRYLLDH